MFFAPQRRATFHLSSDHMAPHSPRLREPTFRPSGGFRDLPTFSRTWNFFLLTLSLFDLLSSSLIFFDSSHLCFSSVHIVGSLTSKLPSNSAIYRTSMPSCVCVCVWACFIGTQWFALASPTPDISIFLSAKVKGGSCGVTPGRLAGCRDNYMKGRAERGSAEIDYFATLLRTRKKLRALATISP